MVELLAFTTLVAVGVHFWLRQRAAGLADKAAVRDLHVQFEQNRYEEWQPWGPTWLRRLFGDSAFADFDRVVEAKLRGSEIRAALTMQRLKKVNIIGPVSTSQLKHLEDLPDLIALDFTEARPFTDRENKGPTPDGESLTLPHLDNLRGLNLHDFDYPNLDIPVNGFHNLRRLDVLDLGNSGISDESMPAIGQVRNLRFLSLDGTQVTSAGLVHLASLTALEELSLDCDSLDDAGIRHLSGLPSLRKLMIGAPLTDASIPAFTDLRRLEALWLWDTEITAVGFEALRASMPTCAVWDGG